MGYVVRMPKMGMSMDQGTVVEWVVGEGDAVDGEDVIAVVESEKAADEVEAREAGVLRRTLVPEGGVVEPGDPIGILADADEDLAAYESEVDADLAGGSGTESASDPTSGTDNSGRATATGTEEDSAADAVRATPGARRRAEEEEIDLAAVDPSGPGGTVIEDDVAEHGEAAREVRATPGARRRADREGVDLTMVDPSGPQGTVIEDDVAAHAETVPGGADGATRTVREGRELSSTQQTVADRLGQSYREAIHVTLDREIDADALQTVAAAADDAGVAGSFTDLLLAGVGDALATHPEVNALFEDGEHRLIEEVNVGVAVDVDGSLLTPVVPDVATRTVESINAVRTERAEAVAAGDHTVDDLSGGTFTVSNLGPFGVDSFDPVINPPQVAILGIGRIRDDGGMTLSLSFDHRVLNGAGAARFLDTLATRLTDPGTLADRFAADLDVSGTGAGADTTGGSGTESGSDLTGPRQVRAESPEGYAGRYRTAFGDVDFDEPEDAGGSGSAPAPVDHLLGALGSCLSLSVRAMADRDDVPVDEIDAEVVGSPEEGPLSAVEVDILIETDADEGPVDRVVTKAERACYVHRALSEDLSVSVDWSRR